MILYHVTTDLQHDGKFTPWVPKTGMKTENKTINRVCVAPTIEGCLTSMPSGSYSLTETLEKTMGQLKVFVIDTEKLGIQNSEIVKPQQLYQSKWVDDAYLTDEHWILSPFVVEEEDSYIINVASYEEKWEAVLDYETHQEFIVKNLDLKDYEALLDAYYEKFDEEPYDISVIHQLKIYSDFPIPGFHSMMDLQGLETFSA